jgi:ADP-ribose pyrophosphatase YjhB (NUDIX family)
MIIENDVGAVLLVRHTYVEPGTWMLPGGRLKGREQPSAAAAREMFEEVGFRPEVIALAEFEDTEFWGRRYRTYIFDAVTRAQPRIDYREIEEAAFFCPSDLPGTASGPTIERLRRWQHRRSLPFEAPPFVRLEYIESKDLKFGET